MAKQAASSADVDKVAQIVAALAGRQVTANTKVAGLKLGTRIQRAFNESLVTTFQLDDTSGQQPVRRYLAMVFTGIAPEITITDVAGVAARASKHIPG